MEGTHQAEKNGFAVNSSFQPPRRLQGSKARRRGSLESLSPRLSSLISCRIPASYVEMATKPATEKKHIARADRAREIRRKAGITRSEADAVRKLLRDKGLLKKAS